MACRVFEFINEDQLEPSKRYQDLFDTLEQDLPNKEKAIKYSLLDGFPDSFTVNNNGNLIVKGNMKDGTYLK